MLQGFLIGSGGDAGITLEYLIKMTEAVVPHLIGDIENGKIGGFQKAAGIIDLDFGEKRNQGFPRIFLKIPEQHRRRIMAQRINFCQGTGEIFSGMQRLQKFGKPGGISCRLFRSGFLPPFV